MIKKTIKHAALFILAAFVSITTIAQTPDWNTGGNLLSGSGILGSSTNFDILFQTDGINRMRLMETGNSTIDGYTVPVGGHLGLSLTPSFFGTGAGGSTPYSLLHLNGFQNSAFGPQEFGYRDWMRPGIVFTHNSDLMYVGPKVGPGGEDITDAVISWSDNSGPGPVGPDVMRFLYTGSGSGSTTINNTDLFDASDYDGVEIARMTGDGTMGIGTRWSNTIRPKRTLDIVRRKSKLPQLRLTYNVDQNQFGGTYSELQTSEDGNLHLAAFNDGSDGVVAIGFLDEDLDDPSGPNYRLDVGGAARIRDLPIYSPECILIGESFADVNQADSADQFIGRLDFPEEPDPCIVLSSTGQWENVCDLSTDCRWEDIVSGTGVGNSDIRTGFDPQADCYRQNVVIGAGAAKSKLSVEARTERDNSPVGVSFDMTDSDPGFDANSNGDFVTALVINTEGINANNGVSYAGIRSNARLGKFAIGVEANASGAAQNSVGVYATATGSTVPVGVYSEVPGNGISFLAWGGTPVNSSFPIIISDQSLKSDIEPVLNASEIVSQLNPVTYSMVSPDNREVGFEEGIQYGFIAQEVQEILPDIVHQVIIPESRDSLGAFIEGTELDLLGIQYEKLIPILVAGFQEQNAEMAAQVQENEALLEEVNDLKTQMAEMQEQMTTVLAAYQRNESKMNNCCGTTPTEKGSTEKGGIELEQNFPNPFDEVTTINFSITEPAQIRLEISDSKGRVLDVLINARMEKGEYTERWDALAFAPGTYYYSLYADTELLTKKMIKK